VINIDKVGVWCWMLIKTYGSTIGNEQVTDDQNKTGGHGVGEAPSEAPRRKWGGCGVEAELTSSRVESGGDNWLNSPNSLARHSIFFWVTD